MLCTEWKGLANDKLWLGQKEMTAGRVDEGTEEQLNEVSGLIIRLLCLRASLNKMVSYLGIHGTRD